MVVMDVFTRRIIGFGVAAANLDGPVVRRMFDRAIAKQRPPRHLSSDHDPLFRFHRWLANLRVLEVDEIKPFHVFLVPMLSLSDRSGRCGASISIGHYFGTKAILSGSSRVTRPITTNTGVTAGWSEPRRLNAAAPLLLQSQTFNHIAGSNTATPYFRPQLPHELEFDTDRSVYGTNDRTQR